MSAAATTISNYAISKRRHKAIAQFRSSGGFDIDVVGYGKPRRRIQKTVDSSRPKAHLAFGEEVFMPEKETIERAQEDARAGKSPSTQAGEFVREEMHHVREGKHGARSTKQAIAIGLSKARRAGVQA